MPEAEGYIVRGSAPRFRQLTWEPAVADIELVTGARMRDPARCSEKPEYEAPLNGAITAPRPVVAALTDHFGPLLDGDDPHLIGRCR